jgi:serine/threonine-protein kinase
LARPVSETDSTTPDIPCSSALSAGDVVAERYRIEAMLGEGGMAVVYRVTHTNLRKSYALKVLRPEWSSMPEMVARFEREAIAAGRIQSPHVVAATDCGRLTDESFFLVMEYVEGATLRRVLAGGALEPARAIHILRGILVALGAAHALGIVHRDVKPENVMLVQRHGEPDFVKVLDFGLAKFDVSAAGNELGGAPALTQAGTVMGTFKYMAPEQALGQPVDARSDIYSAGVILFEMLSGACPFHGDALTIWRQHVAGATPELPVDVAARLDPGLRTIVRRMLATAPENRFESVASVMSAFDDEMAAAGGAADGTRASVESMHGIVTSVATRAQRTPRASVDGVRDSAKGALANGAVLIRSTRRVWEAARRVIANREGFRRIAARVQDTVRDVLASPRASLRQATRWRLVVALVLVVTLATTTVALLAGGPGPRKTSPQAAVRSVDPVSVVLPDKHSPPATELAAGATSLPLSSGPSSSTGLHRAQPVETAPVAPTALRGQSQRVRFEDE